MHKPVHCHANQNVLPSKEVPLFCLIRKLTLKLKIVKQLVFKLEFVQQPCRHFAFGSWDAIDRKATYMDMNFRWIHPKDIFQEIRATLFVSNGNMAN